MASSDAVGRPLSLELQRWAGLARWECVQTVRLSGRASLDTARRYLLACPQRRRWGAVARLAGQRAGVAVEARPESSARTRPGAASAKRLRSRRRVAPVSARRVGAAPLAVRRQVGWYHGTARPFVDGPLRFPGRWSTRVQASLIDRRASRTMARRRYPPMEQLAGLLRLSLSRPRGGATRRAGRSCSS